MSSNETCSEGRTVHYLSDLYPSKLHLEQEDASALLRLKFVLVYTIREDAANYKGLKFNGTPEILLCANLLT